MKTVGPRGIQTVHTISCYKDTWSKFTELKKNHDKTADEMLNLLINGYTQKTIPTEEKVLIELKNEIQKKINNLKK